MLSAGAGLALIAFGCIAFWRLMPRDGQVHALVQKYDGGQMMTIALMTVLTAGIALFCDGVFG